jgi:hypothetical protein
MKENNKRINSEEKIGYIKSTNKNEKDVLFMLERYQFYAALIFKGTYRIFHKNKELFELANEILKKPEKYFHTSFVHENRKRKEHYDFFNNFKFDNFSFSKMEDLYGKYNYILNDLFGFLPEKTFLLDPIFNKSFLKNIFVVPLFYFIFKGYVKLEYFSDYKVFLENLEIEIQKIKPKIQGNTNEFRDILFKIFPQFKEDYKFFLIDSIDKAQIICETEHGLVWTASEGALAHYFKWLNQIGFSENKNTLEKVFRVDNLEKKAQKNSKEWYELQKRIENYRKDKNNN